MSPLCLHCGRSFGHLQARNPAKQKIGGKEAKLGKYTQNGRNTQEFSEFGSMSLQFSEFLGFFLFWRWSRRLQLCAQDYYITILFKIVTRIKLKYPNYLGLLQLQFSGPTGINFRYSYSFVGLTGICLCSYSYVQLYKNWSSELFSENCSYSYTKNWFLN